MGCARAAVESGPPAEERWGFGPKKYRKTCFGLLFFRSSFEGILYSFSSLFNLIQCDILFRE
jgi:hypothetical protein